VKSLEKIWEMYVDKLEAATMALSQILGGYLKDMHASLAAVVTQVRNKTKTALNDYRKSATGSISASVEGFRHFMVPILHEAYTISGKRWLRLPLPNLGNLANPLT
jgi:hypothetical protein